MNIILRMKQIIYFGNYFSQFNYFKPSIGINLYFRSYLKYVVTRHSYFRIKTFLKKKKKKIWMDKARIRIL